MHICPPFVDQVKVVIPQRCEEHRIICIFKAEVFSRGYHSKSSQSCVVLLLQFFYGRNSLVRQISLEEFGVEETQPVIDANFLYLRAMKDPVAFQQIEIEVI